MLTKLKQLFDVNYIKRNTPDYKRLAVTLRKVPNKGVGLVAAKNIRRGAVVAYYRITVFEKATFKSPTKGMYSFTIYTKNDNSSRKFIGDLSVDSLPPPCNGVPYWAYFSNEPSGDQKENARIDINLKYNYKNRATVKTGDTMVYVLKAKRTIKKGDEITWCYGEDYPRKYKPNC